MNSSMSMVTQGSPIRRQTGMLSNSFGAMLMTDMNNYRPLQIMCLGDIGLNISAVADDVCDETLLLIRFYNRLCIYIMAAKIRDEVFVTDKHPEYNITKLQECSLNQQTTYAAAINPMSSASIPVKRLIYAFSLLQQDTIFVVKQTGTELNTEVDILQDEHLVTHLKGHGATVTHLAFDQEEGRLLAVLSEDKTCNVWDVDKKLIIATFPLRSSGTAVSWHKSQRYKLMVTERDGWIKFFNVAKQVCVQSINVFRSPLLCADWSPNNCLHVGLGTFGAGLLIDTSVLNSQNTKIIETMSDTVNGFAFSSADARMFATLGKPQGELKLWQQGYTRHVWSQRKEKMQAFTWLPGKPYIIALAGNNVLIFDASAI